MKLQLFRSFVSKVFVAAMIVILGLNAVTPAYAASTGFSSPTACTSPFGEWSNATNALTSNDQRATSNNDGEDMTCSFNLPTIPAGNVISGIEVRVEGYASSSRDPSVDLSWNGGGTYTSGANGDLLVDVGATEQVFIVGGTTQTWNRTWAIGDFTAANFRVRLTSDNDSGDLFVDHVQVNVHYVTATSTTLVSDINPSAAGQTVTFTATVTPSTATGTVTFLDGGTPIGSGTLSGGMAAFSTSTLVVGQHNITAVYGGDPNFGGSTSTPVVQAVSGPPTFVSTNSTTFTVLNTGQSFQMVASGYPAPTFTTSDPLPAGVTLSPAGVLSGTPATGTARVYDLVVTASNGINPDATQNFTLTVAKRNQTINFNAPGAAQFGTTFTINPTASSGLPVNVIVTDNTPPTTPPAGCTLAGNVVTMTTSTVNCVLTASQAGNADYNAANPVVETITAGRANVTVSVDPTPHTFTNPSQSFYSHPITFSITVASSGGIPTGTVTLTGGTPGQNQTATLDAFGKAQITIINLNMNAYTIIFPHSLNVTYNGDANFNTDTENVQHVVYPAPTRVSVTSDINPSAEGQLVTFTISVSTTPPGSGNPLGTVTLWDGSTQLTTTPIALTNGIAEYSISTLAFGSHNISARYVNTSDNYATSNNTANPYVQVVSRATTTTLTSDNNPSIYGENVAFTATVTSATPGTINGTMTFKDGATPIGTGTVVNGVATFTTNALAVGTHPITAVYSGNATFATSTSAVLDQVVDQATLAVTANNQTITYGDADPVFTFTYTGFLLGDTAAGIDTPPTCDVTPAHVNVGTYPITCSGAADDKYTFTYMPGTLTVARKPLTITADNQGKAYGTPFTFTGTEFTATGLIFTDTVTSVTLTSAGAPAAAAAGTYPILPSAAVGSGLNNYAITYANGTMTVGTNVLTISANNQTKTYGDTFTFAGTEFTVAGLQGSDTVTSVTFTSAGAPSAADVGTYPILPSAAIGTGLGNYTIVYNNGTMDVNQRALTFNPDNQTKVYGSVFTAYTGTFTGLRLGDNITPVYDSLGAPASATIAGSPYPITVTLNDPDGKLANYVVTIDPAPAATLTVTPKPLTVTADNQTKPYGTTFTFTGTEFTTSGLTNGDTVTNITLTSAGAAATAVASPPTYPIVASAAVGTGLSNYAITYVNGAMTVTRPDLVVTSDNQTKTYGDVFTAFTGSIIGIQNGDNITAAYNSLGAPANATFGTYPITITLIDPDGKLVNYNVIQNVGTLTVTRRDLTVIADDKTKVYGDPVMLTGTMTGVQAGDNITFTYSSPGTALTAPVGTYSIAITLNDPLNRIGNYNFTLTPATLTVTARALIVTPDDKSKQYGTWFFAFTGTITGIQNGDSLTANYSSTGSLPSAAVGAYPILATLNDPTGKLGNYNVTLNEGTLTVGSSVLTVTAEDKTISYGSPDPAFTMTYFGFAAGDTPAVIDTPPTCAVAGPHTDVGTYPIVCSGGVDNAYTFTYVPGTLTITPRALVVTPTDKTKVYGDVFTLFSGTISGIQFTDNITATYASTGAPATAAIGDYPITATLNDPGNRLANYSVTLNQGTLTVTLRALTVTPADKTKVYGDVFTLFTGTITGIQNGDPITATYTSPGAAANATVAGSPYPITATLNTPAGVLANYSIVTNTGSLTVTPRALVVTPDNKVKVFGTVFTAFTGTVSGTQAGDVITPIYTSAGAPATAPVGTYPITATLGDPGNRLTNYTVTLNQGTLTVGLSILTVTANNQTITYGDPDPLFTFNYAGFVGADTPAVLNNPPSCQVSGLHNNIGTHPITCSGGIDDNYVFSYVPATLTVTPRALTVTPANSSKVYGDTFTAFSGTITGIQGGDNITATYASTGAPATAAIGTYPITAALNDPAGRLNNYTITLNTGTLTVTERALLVTPTNASKIYGNVFTTFTGTIVGIQNGDAITGTYTSPGAAAAAPVGTYPITATLNAGAGVLTNYTVVYNTGTLAVTSRDLTVIPADKTKAFGTVFTAFTGSVVGIQNNDNITATYSSTGTPATAAVGTYPITAAPNDPNNSLANYNVSLNTGTLTVTQAATTTAVTSDNNPAGVAELVTFTATVISSAGTPTGMVTFFDDANAMNTVALTNGVASFGTSTLTAGVHKITATYSGDQDFSGNTSAPYIQGVGRTATTTVVTSNNNPSAPGQAVTFTATVSSTTGVPTGTVTFNDGATALGTGTLNAGTATFTTSTLPSGSHSITASYEGDTDFFMSVSAPLTQVVVPDTTIDTTPPNPDSDITPTFTFSSNVSTATFACRMDGSTFSACASGDTFGPLAGGNHSFEVRAIDAYGNADPTPASYSWRIDLGMPETQIDSKPPVITNSGDAAFTFSSPDSDVVSFECQLDGTGGFSACTSPQNLAGLSAGSHTFEVRAVDNAGNRDPSPASYTWIVDLGYPTVINTVPAKDAKINGLSTKFKVTFSKDVLNVPSGSPNYADSASNPANYLLLEDGLNDSFDTKACGPVSPDDVSIPITIPVYTNGTPAGKGPFIAAFTVNGGVHLPDGTYRLFICGTTSIHDLAGNTLNNGTSDTIINFTVDHTVSSGGGGNGGGGNNKGNKGLSGLLIPNTGFPQGTVTTLNVQPADKAYSATDLWLEIPRLGVKISIVGVPQTGDGWDVSWLGKEAGWLNGSAYPTWSGNSVLTGHVWDALNQPGPFARLKELKYGDQIKIHIFGQIYTYQVTENTLISPSNTAAAFKHEEKTWITLITCEDYKELSKTYSSRRMIRAALVSITKEK